MWFSSVIELIHGFYFLLKYNFSWFIFCLIVHFYNKWIIFISFLMHVFLQNCICICICVCELKKTHDLLEDTLIIYESTFSSSREYPNNVMSSIASKHLFKRFCLDKKCLLSLNSPNHWNKSPGDLKKTHKKISFF